MFIAPRDVSDKIDGSEGNVITVAHKSNKSPDEPATHAHEL